METKKAKPDQILLGWDDNRIYFYDEDNQEWCVNDYPDLMAKLKEICQEYLARESSKLAQ